MFNDFQADLTVLIDNLLDIWSQVDPARIVIKPKLHILQHLPEDIQNFGPPILFATEIFECFNAIFRLCSVLSNHQAPSHDIATKFSQMDGFKHVTSGGFWKSKEGEWVQAGKGVLAFFEQEKTLQQSLGWADMNSLGATGIFFHILILRFRLLNLMRQAP